jgi:hypothetical protein
MESPYDSTSSRQGTTQRYIDLRDPLVNGKIMWIGEIFAVGDGMGRGKISMIEGYLIIPTPKIM